MELHVCQFQTVSTEGFTPGLTVPNFVPTPKLVVCPTNNWTREP